MWEPYWNRYSLTYRTYWLTDLLTYRLTTWQEPQWNVTVTAVERYLLNALTYYLTGALLTDLSTDLLTHYNLQEPQWSVATSWFHTDPNAALTP